MEIRKMKFRKIILGASLLVAAGSSCSISSAMESTYSTSSDVVGTETPITLSGIEKVDDAQFDHKNWTVNCKGTCDVSLPNEGKSTLQYFIKSHPEGHWSMAEKPLCSILMDNGAQIDYTPGVAAIWLKRDHKAKNAALLTGKFKWNDLYCYSAEEFSDILMNADFIYAARPVHVTFSDGGSFPIQHPESIRKVVFRKWIDHQIELGNY